MSGTTTLGDEFEQHLRARGILAPEVGIAEAVELEGGVSGSVYRMRTTDGREWVVKQALDRLKVAQDWHADPARAQNEAHAIRVFHEITPSHVPALVDIDAATNILVMDAAPLTWLPWNHVLLNDAAGPDLDNAPVAATLGRILGDWHRATANDPSIVESFMAGPEFRELRIAPFHEAVRARHPRCATVIDRCIDELEHDLSAVIHGDFSPKNVLVDPGSSQLWVLDFEVAHAGPPVFDVAFFTSHLLMKAIHRPSAAGQFFELRSRFLAAYGGQPLASLGAQTACLLLARVDGLSPTAYLTETDRSTIRDWAVDVLSSSDPEAVFADILTTK
ncbi:MAG: aminoglycoside phosphotransferase family protein, partial [Pseudolysinimonas sp.]